MNTPRRPNMKYITATFLLALWFGFGLAAIAPLYAQAPAEGGAETAPQKTSLLDLIKAGGWAMYPLGTLSLAMIAMATVNYQKINAKKMMPPEIVGQIKAAASNRDAQKIFDLCVANDSLFTNALAAGLRKLNPHDLEGSKPNVEQAISEAVGREENQLGFWINFLSLISAVSPMVGLLGTVSGMIGAFQKIGAGGMGKPEQLAGDIGQALITTATGLIIAIPAMFFFFMFRNILNRLIQKAEMDFSIVLDDLTGVGLEEEEG